MKNVLPEVELYLIRHAQTPYNATYDTADIKVGGRSNFLELTDLGSEQAVRLGRVAREKGLLPDYVYASPAVRTLTTARLSLVAMQLDMEPQVEDDLQELSQGAYEGRPFKEVFNDAERERMRQMGKDHKLDGGESFREVGQRMFEWMTRTFDGSQPAGRRYFAYSHGNAIRCLIGHMYDLDRDEIYSQVVRNTSVSLFVQQQGEWRMEYCGKDIEEA